MAIGRTNAIASQDKLFAVIAVTYPVGSILTCTDGKKTLRAKTTSGLWLFSIPYAAMWTVTAIDGTKTTSKSVEITTESQSVSVMLSYEIWLYNNGDECVAETGGWAAKAIAVSSSYPALAPRVTKAGSTVELSLTSDMTQEWKSGIYVSQKKIDLTCYSTLEFMGRGERTDEYCGNYLIVLPTLSDWASNPQVELNDGTIGRKTLDVSACDGEYYVAIGLKASSNGAMTIMQSLRAY